MGIITVIFIICLILAVFKTICRIYSLTDKNELKTGSRLVKAVIFVFMVAGLIYCLPVFPAGILG